jgi:MFS family permease
MPDSAESADLDLDRLQRRTVAVLAAAQVLGGVAFGATLSLGVLLAAEVSGDESMAGLATAAITFGTALVAIPLAGLARRRGRRISLTTGMLIALVGVLLVIGTTALRSFPLLLTAFALVGGGQAANLQSRFAATDLAGDATRGRALSLVVWATTIGVVLGPNLVGPGEELGAAVGMPPLTGPYLFTVVGQILAVVVYLVGLRPDPLLTAQRLARQAEARGSADGIEHPDRPGAARYAIFAVAGAHAAMVSVMAMTPVHLVHHGASLSIVGLTISLHVAGMYALSPVFGTLSDRIGRGATVLLGQVLLAASLVLAAVGSDSMTAVTIALVLLGLGWSATTVAGSALLTEASAARLRTRRQGISDFTMSLVGAAGAVIAGLVLGWIGYGGLAMAALVLVAAVCLGVPLALSRRAREGRAPRPARR